MLERLELEAFLTLAEELHFGRTAERLHVTTGRVSQLLKKLEGRVGAPLFVRSSRTVELTEIGGQLREDLQSGYRADRARNGASRRGGERGAEFTAGRIHRRPRRPGDPPGRAEMCGGGKGLRGSHTRGAGFGIPREPA
ncbi:LysR family transcriptional regulator [Streptomyces albidoflavus]